MVTLQDFEGHPVEYSILNPEMLEGRAGTTDREHGGSRVWLVIRGGGFKGRLLCANHFCDSFLSGDSLPYVKDPSCT